MFSGHTHQYAVRKAGELADFPVLINGNRTYASVTVKGKKIHVEIVGETKEENLPTADPQPTFVLPDVAALLNILES